MNAQEILVNHVRVGSEHAVRESGVSLRCTMLEELDRE
jgi:hypothetical protein